MEFLTKQGDSPVNFYIYFINCLSGLNMGSFPIVFKSSILFSSQRNGGWVVKAVDCKSIGYSVVGSSPTRFKKINMILVM